jgi:hypothetical protein
MQERLFSVSLTWVRGSYFGEVAGDVVLVVLDLAEHVEEEDAHVLVQVLVVEEELREEGQVLAVDRVLVAVDLEDRHLVLLVAVDLVAGRVEERAVLRVPVQLDLEREEAQAEVADVEAVQVVVVDRVGAEVPGVSGVLAELQPEDGLEFGDFLMSLQLGVVHAEVGVVIGVDVGVILFEGRLLDALAGAANPAKGHPVVVALVEVLEVHVVGVGILISRFGGIIIYNKIR